VRLCDASLMHASHIAKLYYRINLNEIKIINRNEKPPVRASSPRRLIFARPLPTDAPGSIEPDLLDILPLSDATKAPYEVKEKPPQNKSPTKPELLAFWSDVWVRPVSNGPPGHRCWGSSTPPQSPCHRYCR